MQVNKGLLELFKITGMSFIIADFNCVSIDINEYVMANHYKQNDKHYDIIMYDKI